MSKGGARNRSGPQPDPNSGRSEARGLSFDQLPAEGYDGEVPPFPLPKRLVMADMAEDGARWREVDKSATDAAATRETELWAWAWTTPQAAAWAREPWRLMTVAMWVRTYVVCEGSDATAADKGSLHRFADQIGLTPAGLRENGWTIAPTPVPNTGAPTGPAPEPRRRLRAV